MVVLLINDHQISSLSFDLCSAAIASIAALPEHHMARVFTQSPMSIGVIVIDQPATIVVEVLAGLGLFHQ